MTDAFYISDLHIGHQLVAGHRGYDHIPDHDAVLADHWDSAIGHDDHVWVLGDISAGGSAAQKSALEWIGARPGIKHLVMGNHDGCHAMHRNSHKWQADYLQAFSSVQLAARRRIGGVEVLLSHFPFNGDHSVEERHPQWRLRDMGTVLLHGHTHSGEVFSVSNAGTPQIHVGVDAWRLKPVSTGEVEDLIQRAAGMASSQ